MKPNLLSHIARISAICSAIVVTFPALADFDVGHLKGLTCRAFEDNSNTQHSNTNFTNQKFLPKGWVLTGGGCDARNNGGPDTFGITSSTVLESSGKVGWQCIAQDPNNDNNLALHVIAIGCQP